MDQAVAKTRINKLKAEINDHRYLYHVLDRQEISDGALDSLKKELTELENEFPQLITPNSPTQRVGGKPLNKFVKVKHSRPMLSLVDAFSRQDMEDWLVRLTKFSSARSEFFVETKMDGLAVSLIYKNGIFFSAATRGNGLMGEDVTHNIKTIELIPLELKVIGKKLPPIVEVRGEVYMSKPVFAKLNKIQTQKNEKLFANPRNAAAGSIRQLDPKLAAKRNLSFMAYDLVTDLGQTTHQEIHILLKKLGFRSGDYLQVCKSLDQVFKFFSKLAKQRNKLLYWIDGIVVLVNDIKTLQSLGVTGKAPRGIIALKFPAEQVTTKVKDIIVQVGRTGTLTPVAVLKPVQVAGSTVSRATLHNADEIKRLNLKVGDTVIIQKAGDIIPEVVKVLPKLRNGSEKRWSLSRRCPICGSEVRQPSGEVNYYCTNKNCFAIQKEKIYHFVSKAAFDIEGLGPKIVDQLIEEGLIKDAADIFELKAGDLTPLERFADRAASNLETAIDSAKEISLARFIYALGIRHAGEQTAIALAQNFGSLEKIMESSKEELERINDIGEVVAQSIYNYFNNTKIQKFIQRLKQRGVEVGEETVKKIGKLVGKTLVLTGGLDNLTREQAKELIRGASGKVSSSVSKETDYVVAGDEPGSKYEKAKKLGIKIISAKQFLDLVK